MQDQHSAYYGYQDWKIAFLLKGEQDDSLQLHIELKERCGVTIYAPSTFDLFSMTYFPKSKKWRGANSR